MTNIPEPMQTVLRDYCHVEWYEVDELAADLKNKHQTFDVEPLQAQLQEIISAKEIPFVEINSLTSNEFCSAEEARIWLQEIYRRVFPVVMLGL